MRKIKIILLIIIMLTVVCVGLYVFMHSNRKNVETMKTQGVEKLNQITSNFGIPSTWEALEEHVDCKILEIGRSEREVMSDLKKIGDYEVSNLSSCCYDVVAIYFYDDKLYYELGTILLGFNQENQLATKSRNYSLGDPKEMICP